MFSATAVGGSAVGFQNDTQRRDVEQFMLAFDSNLAPVVGQQVTLDGDAAPAVAGPRVDRARWRAPRRASATWSSKGTVAGVPRGWVRLAGGSSRAIAAAEPPISDGALRALAATSGQEITFTCVPPGSGQRIGVDRDGDGFFDQDEIDAGTDPGRCRQHAAVVWRP